MSRPDLYPINQLPPIRTYTHERYLPSAFDTSMTLVEKVNFVIGYLDQTADTFNGVVERWNDVMKWVMDEKLTEDVVNTLIEMADDGKLSNVINNILLGSRSSIHVSKEEPTNLPYSDNTVFWYEDKGENPLEFSTGNNAGILKGVILQDDEPKNYGENIWFDEE